MKDVCWLGYFKLRAPEKLILKLRTLPSRFFLFQMCPHFFRGRFIWRPQNALSFFFFTQNICEPSFFLRANLHNFYWPVACLPVSRRAVAVRHILHPTPVPSPHPTTSHSLPSSALPSPQSPVPHPPTPLSDFCHLPLTTYA